MAGEQRFAMFFEVLLIRIQHAIQPWQKLLSTMIGVQNDWDIIRRGNGANIMGTSDRSRNRSLLVSVGNPLIPC